MEESAESLYFETGWSKLEDRRKSRKLHLHLRNRLLDQGYKKIRLIRSLKKFIFRYQDLVEIYSVSAETIPVVTITVFEYRNKIGKTVVKTVPYSVNINVRNTYVTH
jgi:hypothetical protein